MSDDWPDEGHQSPKKPETKTRPERGVADDPVQLLALGTTVNDRLIGAITRGYARGSTEDEMIMMIFDNLCRLPPRQIAAQTMAALFALARATKWDLVLVNPTDNTRVVIHCDTEEEQTARAMEMVAAQINKGQA